MKQRFLLSLVFVCTFIVSAHAQINKGSTWLGGNIGYSEAKSDYAQMNDSKIKTLSIRPSVGKAIKENLIAGVSVTYTKATTTQEGWPGNFFYRKQTDKQIGGGVFLRQYVPVVSRLYIFGEAAAAYRNTKTSIRERQSNTNPTTALDTKGWDVSLGLTPGVSYAINNKLQLETGFNSLFSTTYGKSKTTSDNPDVRGSTRGFSTGINLENESTFYIGFRFLINSKG